MNEQYCVTVIYNDNRGIGKWFFDYFSAEKCVKEAKKDASITKISLYKFIYHTKKSGEESLDRRITLSIWERTKEGAWTCKYK